VNRHAKDSEVSKTTLLKCRYSNELEKLKENFGCNFNFLAYKEKKVQKCKAPHKEEILKNGVLLIILNNEEAEDAS
jgi:hypothetical protein